MGKPLRRANDGRCWVGLMFLCVRADRRNKQRVDSACELAMDWASAPATSLHKSHKFAAYALCTVVDKLRAPPPVPTTPGPQPWTALTCPTLT
jgi:hypothetical protein